MKKIVLVFVAALTFCLGIGAATVAQKVQAEICPHFTVIVDGEKQTFSDANGTEVYPLIYNGTTYLPVRSIGNLMGKNVGWDGATNTITLNNQSTSANGLLYEDEYMSISFIGTERKKQYSFESDNCTSIKLNIHNKTNYTLQILCSTIALNNVSYTDMGGWYKVSPQSSGVLDFYKDEALPLKGISRVSGEFSIDIFFPDERLDYTATFASIDVE